MSIYFEDIHIKKWARSLLACLLTLLAVTSCTEDLGTSDEMAILHLSISDYDAGVTTRALPSELPKPMQEAFQLQILDEQRNLEVYHGAFQSAVGPFRPGKYRITVACGEDKLALNAPYYSGQCEATLLAGFQNIYTVTARVANALLSVQYDEQDVLDSYFSEYGISVTLGSESVDLAGDAPDHSAYFPADSHIQVAFHGKVRESGETHSVDLSPSLAGQLPLQSGEHLTVHIGLNADQISVLKAEVEQVGIRETIPAEWLPKPKMAVEGFDDAGVISNVETVDVETAEIAFTTSMATQDIELTLDLQDEGYRSFNGTYLLSTMDEAQKSQIRQMGIILPELGTTSGNIDLKHFASNLCTNRGVTTVNRIGVRVKANDRWSSETPETYTIEVEKPTMTVTAREENAWTKEFTIDEAEISTGNAEKIKANLKYQYSPDGNVWYDCNQVRRQQFQDHPAVKTYWVRAIYRNAVVSPSSQVTLETPTQLPNSGMEDWYYSNVARKMNCYYPWASGGTSFWNTNNPYTTRYVNNVGIFDAGSNPYNCIPAVSYVVGGRSGARAAEIRSTASGRGNTLPRNVLTLNKVPGELFTGEVDVVMGGTAAVPKGDHYTIDENGRSFNVRPTALRFWYKYNQLNTDKWRAKIVLMDANHQVIIEKELQSSGSVNDWEEKIVPLDYQAGQTYAKCRYIYVVFSSSIHKQSDDMPYQEYSNGYEFWEGNNLVRKNDTKCWFGSILTIDDISLDYDR